MKSGVYYLYEYNHDQKTRNVGFLKISHNQTDLSIQICARGVAVLHNEKACLSALYKNENLFTSIETIWLSCEDHAITEKLYLSEDALTRHLPIDHICGFLIALPNHTFIAALEDGVLFSPSLLTISEESLTSDEEPSTEISSESDISETEENTVVNVQRISHADLSILPRCHWHLANNSFLMHGYHNYNHLLLIEEDGHTLLGVPGIYDKREAKAAELFGFPLFSDTHANQLQSAEENTQPLSHFGYWCRKL